MHRFTAPFTSGGRDVDVEFVGPIETDEDRRTLRAATDFHDGTVALLTYPSRVVAFIAPEPPRMTVIPPGVYLAKGPAGDLQFIAPEVGDELAKGAL